jgi:alpha-beta hydrolase superfamily lysophospholipase
MNKLVMVGLHSLLAGVLCSTSPFAAPQQLDGHWEGAITQPAGALKIAVDFARQGDTITGRFTLPASAAFKWPLRVTSANANVQFKMPTGVTFDGTLQGDTISGTVPSPTGGHTDPFYLKRQPAPPLPYSVEDVRFQSGGVTLAGTLRLPLAKGPHPALFLLQGSGDVDRESESFFADYFSQRGIATLVYDKRGTGSSEGDYRQSSFTDFASDALAGVRYLRERQEINRTKVGLYGRSHGGMVAPLAASLSRDIAFIINVSGAIVPPYQQVTYQAEAQMRRDGFAETEIAEALAYMHQKWDVARSGGEGWAGLQAATEAARNKRWLARAQPATKLADIVPSWKLQMGYDPMPALEGVRCPVLAVFGKLDTLTPVVASEANLRKGLDKAGNKAYTIKVFPDADHALLVWPKPNEQAHWPVLVDGFLDTMANWIRMR